MRTRFRSSPHVEDREIYARIQKAVRLLEEAGGIARKSTKGRRFSSEDSEFARQMLRIEREIRTAIRAASAIRPAHSPLRLQTQQEVSDNGEEG